MENCILMLQAVPTLMMCVLFSYSYDVCAVFILLWCVCCFLKEMKLLWLSLCSYPMYPKSVRHKLCSFAISPNSVHHKVWSFAISPNQSIIKVWHCDNDSALIFSKERYQCTILLVQFYWLDFMDIMNLCTSYPEIVHFSVHNTDIATSTDSIKAEWCRNILSHCDTESYSGCCMGYHIV